MTNEERLRADRNAWKNAANHLMNAIRNINTDQLTSEQQTTIAYAITEYNTAKQGINK